MKAGVSHARAPDAIIRGRPSDRGSPITLSKLAFIGYGNVGRALARLLARKQAELHDELGIDYTVVGLATRSHGIAIDPAGIDVLAAAERLESGGALDQFHTGAAVADVPAFIARSGADVLVELSYLNPDTGQPALDYCRAALKAGMHVITANKGPVVHAYRELRDLAAAQGRRFYFEAAVMDGTPIFSTFREGLPTSKVVRFRGVLNSTTNLILTKMEQGRSFDEAVKIAQDMGIAEADPSADVDGWDAAVKASALATVLMDVPVAPGEVERTGIGAVSPEEVQAAVGRGERIKLLCIGERTEAGARVSVQPVALPETDPLSQLDGTSSAVAFELDTLKGLTIVGHNPGPAQTAYGLLADFINAVRADGG